MASVQQWGVRGTLYAWGPNRRIDGRDERRVVITPRVRKLASVSHFRDTPYLVRACVRVPWNRVVNLASVYGVDTRSKNVHILQF
jgi:hypothetical protein